MARPEIENPELEERRRLPPGVVAVAVLGVIGAILLAAHDFGRTPPPTTVTAVAVTNAPAPAPEPVPVTVAPATNRDAVALAAAQAAFDRYGKLVQEGDFWAASNTLRTINGLLFTVELQTNFWRDVLPEDSRTMLTLAGICQACVDGHCGTCSGKGLCTTCNGSGICTLCEGKSAHFARCAACRCATCRGSGRCVTCVGQGAVRCKACGGTGNIVVPRRIPCSVCGGTGQRNGLRRANSSATKIQCMTCRGLGYRDSSQLGVCSTCGGKGHVACASCNGSGHCAVCAGRGQTQPCQVCGSTGQVRIECPRCHGTGACETCNGTKRCATCGGDGNCPTCSGNAIVRTLSLPVLDYWLNQTHGYLVVDAKSGARLASGHDAGPQKVVIHNRKLTFTVAPDEVIWISTDGTFAHAREVMSLSQPVGRSSAGQTSASK